MTLLKDDDSKTRNDLEAQRVATEDERLVGVNALSSSSSSSPPPQSYQPIFMSGDDDDDDADNDDDDDGFAETNNQTTVEGRSSFLSCLPVLTVLLGVLCALLLATNIAMMAQHPQGHGGGWSSTRSGDRPDLPSSKRKRRWVPTVDILNASSSSSPSSNLNNLKFLGDVGSYGLQGLAMMRPKKKKKKKNNNNNNDTASTTSLLYEFHTMSVRVLQTSRRDGQIQVTSVSQRRIYNGTTDFPPIDNNNNETSVIVAHIGGIDISYSNKHGTEIWIATHSNGIDGKGALWAVDPDTLDVKTDRAVRGFPYNLDWVAHHDGILYFGAFFHVKAVKRVLVDTLEPLSDLKLSSLPDDEEGGLNYIQSAAFDLEGRLVLLGDDYQCTVYFIDVSTGELVNSQGLLLGSETDGITFDESGSMLVGFNRQHSHEQVMGQEPMLSVIQLDLR